jgi:hypothetical protein
MGKTHSKPLAARHGRGTAWARHAMCESAFSGCRLANTQPTLWSDTRNPVDWCTAALVISRDESEIPRNRLARLRKRCGPTRNSTVCTAPCKITVPQSPLLFVLFCSLCCSVICAVLFFVLFCSLCSSVIRAVLFFVLFCYSCCSVLCAVLLFVLFCSLCCSVLCAVLLFVLFCYLCCSVYCLCVNVYFATATGCQPNCS